MKKTMKEMKKEMRIEDTNGKKEKAYVSNSINQALEKSKIGTGKKTMLTKKRGK